AALLTVTMVSLTCASLAQLPPINLPQIKLPPAPAEPPTSETDMVLLTVSVAAAENRSVPLLPRERFEVLEDGVPQKITYFWEDSRPISVGILIDDSGFMGK